MKTISVLLEGDDNGRHYFVTFETVSTDSQAATALSLAEAGKLGLSIVGVEDVEAKHVVSGFKRQHVVNVSGKSYFDEETE